MRKWFLTQFITLIALNFLISSSAHAQSFFGSTTSQNSRDAAQSSKVMSPDEFSKAVNTLKAETDANLTQKINQNMAKPQAALTPPIQPPPSEQNAQPSMTPEEAPAKIPTPPVSPPETSVSPPPISSNTTTNNIPTTQALPQPPPIQPPPSQQQTYTGFAAPQPKNATTPSTNSSSQSSGWGIKY